MPGNLTKRDIVLDIYQKTSYPQKEVKEVVQLTLDAIARALSSGQNVELRNFGVFEIQVRKARIGRNPNKPEIDVDFADKWAEAIGQSLSYGLNLNLKPAIVLIMEQENDERHFIRINTIIKHYQLNIEVFPIRVFKGEGLKK